MKAERFFSMAYDIRNHPKVALLRGWGGMAAFGRWVALMGILYDCDGAFRLASESRRKYLMRELEIGTESELQAFLDALADCDLIDAALLADGSIASRSIAAQIDYYRQKSEAGKKGMASRWGKKDAS